MTSVPPYLFSVDDAEVMNGLLPSLSLHVSLNLSALQYKLGCLSIFCDCAVWWWL